MGIDLDFSYDLDGFEFGRGTVYHIASVEFEEGELTTNDFNQPRTDGLNFGREYRGGRTVAFSGNILTNRVSPGDPIAAPLAQGALAAAWDREDVRLTPGAVLPLRMQRNSRRRRVYGRPRRFMAVAGATTRGRIPFECDFQCSDNLFYDDIEEMRVVPFVPSEGGGLIGPLIGPWISSSMGVGTNELIIGGTKPSWLVMKIFGPTTTGSIVDPDIEIVGQWRVKLLTTIAYDDSVVIDPRPWSRSIRRTLSGGNLSGVFTANSPRISAMRVPPGDHQVILRGIDPTGTSKVEVYWRDTYATF